MSKRPTAHPVEGGHEYRIVACVHGIRYKAVLFQPQGVLIPLEEISKVYDKFTAHIVADLERQGLPPPS